MSHAYKHNTYWYDLWLLLDIMFFTLVPILCVHVSLWTYNFMIGVYLETYTHENSYILSWYSKSLVTTFLLLLILWWLLKEFALWVLILFSCILLHSYLVKLVALSCFLDDLLDLLLHHEVRHKLYFSFGIFFAS